MGNYNCVKQLKRKAAFEEEGNQDSPRQASDVVLPHGNADAFVTRMIVDAAESKSLAWKCPSKDDCVNISRLGKKGTDQDGAREASQTETGMGDSEEQPNGKGAHPPATEPSVHSVTASMEDKSITNAEFTPSTSNGHETGRRDEHHTTYEASDNKEKEATEEKAHSERAKDREDRKDREEKAVADATQGAEEATVRRGARVGEHLCKDADTKHGRRYERFDKYYDNECCQSGRDESESSDSRQEAIAAASDVTVRCSMTSVRFAVIERDLLGETSDSGCHGYESDGDGNTEWHGFGDVSGGDEDALSMGSFGNERVLLKSSKFGIRYNLSFSPSVLNRYTMDENEDADVDIRDTDMDSGSDDDCDIEE